MSSKALDFYNSTVTYTSALLVLLYLVALIRVLTGTRYSFVILMIVLLLASNVGNLLEVKFGLAQANRQ